MEAIKVLLGDCEDCAKLGEESMRPAPLPDGANGGVGPTFPLPAPLPPPLTKFVEIWLDNEPPSEGGGGGGGGMEENC